MAGTSTPLGPGIRPFKTTPYSKNPLNGPVITGCCSKPQTCFVRAQVLLRTCASDGNSGGHQFAGRAAAGVGREWGGSGVGVYIVMAPGELRYSPDSVEDTSATSCRLVKTESLGKQYTASF